MSDIGEMWYSEKVDSISLQKGQILILLYYTYSLKWTWLSGLWDGFSTPGVQTSLWIPFNSVSKHGLSANTNIMHLYDL